MKNLEKLTQQLAQGRIGRREFLQGATALGVSATVATSMAGKALAAPKRGGRFRYGVAHGSTTNQLDPALYLDGWDLGMDYTIHNHVGEMLADGSLIPEAIESWEASDDAQKWVFNIRKGMEFHDGKTFDADDMVASIAHHRGDDSKSPAKSLLEQIKSIKADGKNQVVVELAAGNADFPFVMSDYHVAMLPSKDGVADATSGNGLGPYVLKDFEPGVRASFTRNPNYHKSDAAYFDEIEMLAIIDVTARTNALTSGEVDAIDRVDLQTVHLLGRTPGVKIEETVGFRHYVFPMRADTSPYDDNNVRMALKHAINRQEIVDKILLGHGIAGNDHPISPSLKFHAGDLEPRTYDIDKAKFYLKQAGLSNIKVQLSAADAAYAGAVDAAVLFKEHAAPAGIDIEVIREPNDGYWSNVWMNKPFCASYWGGRPTVDFMFSTAYAADAPWNDSFWKHDRFNELLIKARAEIDDKKRGEMYFEMQKILRDEGSVIVPMFANYVFAVSDKLGYNKMAGNFEMDGSKYAERWWFA